MTSKREGKTMKRFVVYLGMGLILIGLAANGSAQENQNKKLAQSGMEFLIVKADAKAMGMGGAVTSLDMGSSSLFFNPAGMANMKTFGDVTFSMNEWIADIRHVGFTAAIRPMNGNYGTIGISVQHVDYGEVQWTMVDNNADKGYMDMGIFSPSAISVGLGYAKDLTDRFSVGGQIHWVRQQLGENEIPHAVASKTVSGKDTTITVLETEGNEVSPLSFDFGTLFKTGYKSLAFGMSIRNFSKEVKYSQEGFQLPLTFTMGISMDVLDFVNTEAKDHSLVVSIDAVHYRSRPEQFMVGLNYTFMNVLSLRGGYVSNEDEDSFSMGLGVLYSGLEIDYAYTPYTVFDSVQRLTARISM
jgi:hypothetical protein